MQESFLAGKQSLSLRNVLCGLHVGPQISRSTIIALDNKYTVLQGLLAGS